MTVFFLFVAVAVAFYIGWESAHIHDDQELDEPPDDPSGDLRDLGPYDREAWER